jgi:pheromone shutdown protein TraB
MQRRQIGAASPDDQAAAAPPGEAAELLAARDRFIAQRIAATLAEGETGLLFLGAAHRLDALRALGIAVRTLHRIG